MTAHHVCMSTQYEYFIAATQTDAEQILERGPRGRFRSIDPVAIDPVVQLATLETLLTSRNYSERSPFYSRCIVGEPDSDYAVIQVDASLVQAVMNAEPERLLELAESWAEENKMDARVRPSDMKAFLIEFQELCSESCDVGDLYCWTGA